MKNIIDALGRILLLIIGVLGYNAYVNHQSTKKDVKAIAEIKKRVYRESISDSLSGLNDELS